MTTTTSPIITKTEIETGQAGRKNRVRGGGKVHYVVSTYIVGLAEGYTPVPGTYAAEFARTGQPVLASCYPLCGCTQGQHAARPTGGTVTCEKCIAAR